MTDGPARSLAAIEYLQPEQDGDLRVLLTCDCATMTDLTIRHVVLGGAAAEVAVTCDGCQSTYWFTVSATGARRELLGKNH